MSSETPDSNRPARRHFSVSLYRLHRRALAYRHIWKGRLIFWAGAVLTGLVAVLSANVTEEAVNALHAITDRYPFWPYIVAPLGGALVVWLTRTYFPGSEGSGIPQVMAELADHGRYRRLPKPLLSLRILVAKIVLGVAAIFAGFSAGREGPMVQIGSSFMHMIGQYLPRRLQISRRHLLVAGGAAGIAAAFNTPLAGIVFAIEELNHGFEEGMSGFIITAIVIAGVVGQAFFGNYVYFGWINITGVENTHPIGLLLAAAVVCGVAGGTFSRLLLYTTSNRMPGPLGRWRAEYPIRFAAACGLVIAILGTISGGLSFGTGYGEAKHLLAQDAVLPWHYGIDKFLATLVSFTSGIPGGLFAPSLAVGAGIGENLHSLFQSSYQPGMTNVLCMAGFLAAVTQTPITAFVIVMEMVSGYGMVIDLMIVTLVASGVSRAICPPLYRTLAMRYLSQGTKKKVESPEPATTDVGPATARE